MIRIFGNVNGMNLTLYTYRNLMYFRGKEQEWGKVPFRRVCKKIRKLDR